MANNMRFSDINFCYLFRYFPMERFWGDRGSDQGGSDQLFGEGWICRKGIGIKKSSNQIKLCFELPKRVSKRN
jgi:hypothetical protein